ncbi:MAG: hypothetical protein JWQ55_3971 [Rhodopila sp.]|nr:hypothetical protein [Rhodopila sp.]
MSNKRPAFQTSQDLAFTVRVRPIGSADLVFMQNAMAESAPDWSVELQGICADEATLVLLPEDGDDAIGPSFMVSRETCGFRVDQVHWDVVTEVGVFTSMNDVIDVLRLSLAFCGGLEAPASVTLH